MFLDFVIKLDKLVYRKLHIIFLLTMRLRLFVRLAQSFIIGPLRVCFCLQTLLFNQIALEKAIVQLYLSQPFQIFVPFVSKFVKNPLQKLGHQIVVINKNLQ